MADLKALKNKTIITVAPTGAWPKKKDNPNVPMEPEEIAADVYECWKAGAAVAHLHMRDADGNGAMDPVRFKKTVELIKGYKDCDIVLNLTTSGDIHADDEIRVAHVKELKPEMASFDAGTMNWLHTVVFMNEPGFLEKCGEVMKEVNVKPEIEVFDMGMLNTAKYYLKKGIIEGPAHFQLCLGAPGGMEATTENLVYLVNHLPEDCTWSTFGIGRGANEILLAGIAMGGNVRVGLEDNVYYNKGVLAESNEQFIARVVRIAREMGKEPATPDEAREILGV